MALEVLWKGYIWKKTKEKKTSSKTQKPFHACFRCFFVFCKSELKHKIFVLIGKDLSSKLMANIQLTRLADMQEQLQLS